MDSPSHRRTARTVALLALTGSLLGMVGLPWDVAQHVQEVREEVFSPQHLLILAGLGAWALAGLLGIVRRPDGASVASQRGALVTMIGAGTALSGFPLDALWHELFGLDVTLWGPTHLLMLLGGAAAAIGTWLLLLEAWPAGATLRSRVPGTVGAGLLIATLASFQMEYDFGVPQFSLAAQPALVAFALVTGLVAARAAMGRGAAIGAALMWSVVVGLGVNAFLTGVAGFEPMHTAIALPAALLVELVWLVVPARARVVAAGLLVGTFGVAAEHAWDAWRHDIGWSLAGGDLALAAGGAVVVALIGARAGAAIAHGAVDSAEAPSAEAISDAPARRPHATRHAIASTLVGAGAVAGVLVVLLALGGERPIPFEVTDVEPLRGGATDITFAIEDDVVEGATWANVTSVHGGGMQVTPLERTGSDAWVARGVPADGTWQDSLRIAHGNDLQAMRLRALESIYSPERVELREGGAQVTHAEQPVPMGDSGVLLPALAYALLALVAITSLIGLRLALLPGALAGRGEGAARERRRAMIAA